VSTTSRKLLQGGQEVVKLNILQWFPDRGLTLLKYPFFARLFLKINCTELIEKLIPYIAHGLYNARSE
jgi:hypothetical protein